MTAQHSAGYEAAPEPAVDIPEPVIEAPRTAGIRVRLTPDEHARYTAFAEQQGRSLSEVMRLSVEWAIHQEAIYG